jgi:hypothetical protein
MMLEQSSWQNFLRHVDIRYHFIREVIEDGFVKNFLSDQTIMEQICLRLM